LLRALLRLLLLLKVLPETQHGRVTTFPGREAKRKNAGVWVGDTNKVAGARCDTGRCAAAKGRRWGRDTRSRHPHKGGDGRVLVRRPARTRGSDLEAARDSPRGGGGSR
jgi:hypothetical protein